MGVWAFIIFVWVPLAVIICRVSTILAVIICRVSTILAVVIIIIIKKGQQCKAGREWYTPYQSEDPSPTIPTNWQKEEKGKESRRL